MVRIGFLGIAAGLAVAAALAVAPPLAPPLAVPIGLAVAATLLVGSGFVRSVIGLFAPEPFHWLQSHPRSIFETRRAGLA